MVNEEKDSVALHKRWRKLTITSDAMFGMVMEDKEIFRELINRTLPELHIKELKQLTLQAEIPDAIFNKGVRFDAYAKDEHQRRFVVEMQVVNQHNLPSRLRYYQEQVMDPNDDYNRLAKIPVYVIMFCNFDYFKRGWAQYRFETICVDDHHLKFGDKRVIVVCNAKAQTFQGNEKIRSFLQLMQNKEDKEDKFVKKFKGELKQLS